MSVVLFAIFDRVFWLGCRFMRVIGVLFFALGLWNSLGFGSDDIPAFRRGVNLSHLFQYPRREPGRPESYTWPP